MPEQFRKCAFSKMCSKVAVGYIYALSCCPHPLISPNFLVLFQCNHQITQSVQISQALLHRMYWRIQRKLKSMTTQRASAQFLLWLAQLALGQLCGSGAAQNCCDARLDVAHLYSLRFFPTGAALQFNECSTLHLILATLNLVGIESIFFVEL